MTKSRPVVILTSILAGAQALVGAIAFSDAVGPQVAGLLIALLAAVQLGVGKYLEAQVVPVNDVAAYVDKEGVPVVGPAAPVSDPDGTPIVAMSIETLSPDINDPRG